MVRQFPQSTASYLALLATLLMATGCADPQLEKDLATARALTTRWVDRLDTQTTKTGSYIRHDGDRLDEVDPWGNKLRVTYSRGGVSEVVKVSSAGPDGNFDTDDDVAQERMSANLAGVGEGIKENIGEVTESAATGAVKGTIRGLKEGIKESLPQRRKNEAVEDDAAPAEPVDAHATE